MLMLARTVKLSFLMTDYIFCFMIPPQNAKPLNAEYI